MANVKFKTNPKGIRELLTVTVVPDLEARGQRVLDAAGPGHEAETFIGKKRARVTVRTETFEAMRSEATSRTLTRAIDAARG